MIFWHRNLKISRSRARPLCHPQRRRFHHVTAQNDNTTGPWAGPGTGDTVPVHVRDVAAKIPGGDPAGDTVGYAFDSDGDKIDDERFVSGRVESARQRLAGRYALVRTFTDHVEGHVAARLRMPGGPAHVILVQNQEPCKYAAGCDRLLRDVLPVGTSITVYVKDDLSFTVEWGRDESRPDGHGHVVVSTDAELDAILAGIQQRCEATGDLFVVHVYPTAEADRLPGGVQIGVGHPRHAFAYWLGEEGGTAYEPDLAVGPVGLRFDYGGQPLCPAPQELRLRPGTAREIAGEFVRTGRRPVAVSWLEAR